MALTKISRGLLDTGISDSSDATAINIDSSERVGIGTSSPSRQLTVFHSTSATHDIKTSDANLLFNQAGHNSYIGNSSTSGFLQLFTNNGNSIVNMLANGNFGIGTTSPTYKLDVVHDNVGEGTVAQFGGDGGAGSIPDVRIVNTNQSSGSTDEGARLIFQLGSTNAGWIQAFKTADGTTASNRSGGLAFHTSNSNSVTEKMRIDNNGKILVGKTAANITGSAGFELTDAGLNMYSTQTSGGVSSTYHVLYGSSTKFYVDYAGVVYASNTSITSLSDERLKENVKDLDTGLSDILELKPKRFDWKEGEGTGEKNVSGFIAQDVEDTNFSDLVGNFKHNSLNDCKSFQYSGLIPALVKSIQELTAKVEELESKINE